MEKTREKNFYRKVEESGKESAFGVSFVRLIRLRG
jgi:hypothetical protein